MNRAALACLLVALSVCFVVARMQDMPVTVPITELPLCPISPPVTHAPVANPNLVHNVTVHQGDYVDGFFADNRPLVGRSGGAKKFFTWPSAEYVVQVKVYITWEFVNSLIFITNEGRVLGQLGSVTNWPGVLAITNITTYNAPSGYSLVDYAATSKLNADPYYGITLLDSFVPIWGPLLIDASASTSSSCITPPVTTPPVTSPPVDLLPPSTPAPQQVPPTTVEPVVHSSPSAPVPPPLPAPVFGAPVVSVPPSAPATNAPSTNAPSFPPPTLSCPFEPEEPTHNPLLISNITIYQGDYVDGFVVDNRPLVGKVGGAIKFFSWPADEYIVKAQVYVSWEFVNSLIFTTNTGRVIGELGSVTNWPGVLAITNITTYDAPEGWGLVGYNATSRVHPDPYYGAVLVDGFVPIWGNLTVSNSSTPACHCYASPFGNVPNPALAMVNLTIQQGDYVYGVSGNGTQVGSGLGNGISTSYSFDASNYVTLVEIIYSGEYLINGIVFRTNTGEAYGQAGTIERPETGHPSYFYFAESGYGMVGWNATALLLARPEDGRYVLQTFQPIWGPLSIPYSGGGDAPVTCWIEPVRSSIVSTVQGTPYVNGSAQTVFSAILAIVSLAAVLMAL